MSQADIIGGIFASLLLVLIVVKQEGATNNRNKMLNIAFIFQKLQLTFRFIQNLVRNKLRFKAPVV